MRKKKFPKIVKGNHLTVITHADGRVEMEWDWDALQREIAEALSGTKVKKQRKKRD